MDSSNTNTNPPQRTGSCPLVSVIIPTYNRWDLLTQGIESLSRQTYRPLEVVIVDDGSEEDIAGNIRRQQGRMDPKVAEGFEVKCIRQDHVGQNLARNRGLRASAGAFVRFMDSDDTLNPGATRLQVEALLQSGFPVCYGAWYDVYPDRDPSQAREFNPVQPMDDPVACLLGRQWYPNFCYLAKRELAIQCGGWDESYTILCDRPYPVAMAYIDKRFCSVPDSIGDYIHHTGSRASRRSWAAWIAAMKRQLLEGVARLDATASWTDERRSALACSLFYQARRHHREGDKAQFEECMNVAHRIWPAFRVPGSGLQHIAYRCMAGTIGYWRTEQLRTFSKRIFGIKG